MAIKNIFTSVDVVGLCQRWQSTINSYYGIPNEPIQTLQTSGRLKGQYVFNSQLNAVLDTWQRPACKIISAEHRLPDYVRLMSSKAATVGYELLPNDIETKMIGGVEKQFLTNTYNLSIEAKSGDTIVWWGNAITPNSSAQAVVVRITEVGSQAPLRALTNPITKNVQYKYPAKADGSYYDIQTHQTFSYQGQIEGQVDQDIAYDIHLDLVSDNGCVFAQFVCDPHIIIKNND